MNRHDPCQEQQTLLTALNPCVQNIFADCGFSLNFGPIYAIPVQQDFTDAETEAYA